MSQQTQATVERAGLDWLAVLMGVSFALMWSSAFTSAKIALADAPPFILLTVRFFVSGLVAMFIAWMLGQRIPLGRRIWFVIVTIGVCQNSLYLGLNFLAMTKVPAGLAAIIASALPLVVAFASATILKARLSRLAWTGLAIGFAGVIAIMAGRIDSGADTLGIGLCVLGVVALTMATLTVRGADLGSDLLMIVGLQMMVGSITLLPIALFAENLSEINWTWSLLIAFSYTTLIPGVVATLIWFRLVRRIGATHAATYHFLNPAFGILVAALLLNETLELIDAIGVLMITISILIVQLAPRFNSSSGSGSATRRSR